MSNYQTSSGSAYAVFSKLRNDNYFSWSASMESTLRSLNQWEVVIGQFPSPKRADSKAPTDAELELEEAWALRMERAYTEIDLRIEDQQRVAIRDNRDPRLAWNTLRMVYGNRLANARASLLGEITHIQYDGSRIMGHKSRMDSLRLRLIEAGHPVLEPLYLSFFVNTLPGEFDAITNTIDWDNDTVAELVSNLRQV
jgi:gag-polypeptide of LTR copia-type